MRGILLILSMFIVFMVNATPITESKDFTKDVTYFKFDGSTSDLLDGTTTKDSLYFDITLNKGYPIQIYTKSWFVRKLGADTTVNIRLLGKVFEDDDWSVITTGTFAAGAANGGTVLSTIGLTTETFLFDTTKTNAGRLTSFTSDTTKLFHHGTTWGVYLGTLNQVDTKKYYTGTISESSTYQFYRYLRLEYVIAGNDAVGTGLYLDKIEFKLINK